MKYIVFIGPPGGGKSGVMNKIFEHLDIPVTLRSGVTYNVITMTSKPVVISVNKFYSFVDTPGTTSSTELYRMLSSVIDVDLIHLFVLCIPSIGRFDDMMFLEDCSCQFQSNIFPKTLMINTFNSAPSIINRHMNTNKFRALNLEMNTCKNYTYIVDALGMD